MPYTTEHISKSDIYQILLDPDQTLITHEPPVKPKAGETYVVECKTYEDWACDQYPWCFIGKSQVNLSSGKTILKNYYHIRLPGTKPGKGRTRPNKSNKFTRTAYFLEEKPERILVTYSGDEKIYIPLTHGNSKQSNATEYVRSTKSVLNEIKNAQGKPMNVYRKISTRPNVCGEHQGVLNPRNLKQIQNHQAMKKSKEKLGKDDIYNLIQLAYHLEGFVAEITVFPDLLTIFALPEIVNTFVELLQSNANTPVCLVYDTTFNLGDFYVSPLVFKHVLFEGTPWIPLAFLIHDRKLQKCHNRFFEFLADRIPLLKSKKIPFVTDKEPALTKSALKKWLNANQKTSSI